MTRHLNYLKSSIPNYNLGSITEINAQHLVTNIIKAQKLSFSDKGLFVDILNECLEYLIQNNLTDSDIYLRIKDLPTMLNIRYGIGITEEEAFLHAHVKLDTQGGFLAQSFGLFYPRANV